MDAFVLRGYTRITGEEYFGGTSVVRKYKKGRQYFSIKEIQDNSDYPMDKIDKEINVLLELNHPNIIRLLEWFLSPMEMGVYKCLVTEWCEDNLQNYTALYPAGLSVDELHYFTSDIARALQYLVLEKQILHRDLKLSNFLLKRSKELPFPVVKLCDFGSATHITESMSEYVASPFFAAPEMKEGCVYTSKVDVWSLGCCLYWMATGRHVFADVDEDYATLLERQEPIAIPETRPSGLAQLLAAMLRYEWQVRIGWRELFAHPFIAECHREKEDQPGDPANYQVLHDLGRGSFGVVMKGWDKRNQRYVAVKRIARKDFSTEALRAMAMKEIRIIKLFSHPNVSRFYDYYVLQNILHVVMEYCDFGDLQQYIDAQRQAGRGLTPEEVIAFTHDILSGIEYLHVEKHFAHRDVKPSNMLLTRSLLSKLPVVKIADLGLAKRDNYIDPLKTNAGTPAYMAPEVHNGVYTYESDLWSIGCVVYYMCTGSLIFPKSNFRLFFNERRVPSFSKIVGLDAVVDLMRHLLVYDVARRWGWPEIHESRFAHEYNTHRLSLLADGNIAPQQPATPTPEDEATLDPRDEEARDVRNTLDVVTRMYHNIGKMSVEELMSVLYLVGATFRVPVEQLQCNPDVRTAPVALFVDCARDITLEALKIMENSPGDRSWVVLLGHARSLLRVLRRFVEQPQLRIIDQVLVLIGDAVAADDQPC